MARLSGKAETLFYIQVLEGRIPMAHLHSIRFTDPFGIFRYHMRA